MTQLTRRHTLLLLTTASAGLVASEAKADAVDEALRAITKARRSVKTLRG